MVAERSKLQNTIQQQQLELDGHSRARRKLEHENAHLLERVSGFEQQQVCIKINIFIHFVREIISID